MGEARRRGGGTTYAAATEPPKLSGLVGWAALGGVIRRRFPRWFIINVGHLFVSQLTKILRTEYISLINIVEV